MEIYLSLLVCIVGLVVYLVTKPEHAKPAEVGRLMFWVGLFVFLLQFGAVPIGKRP
jgi:hypothetical protein